MNIKYLVFLSFILISAKCNRGEEIDINPGFYSKGFALQYTINKATSIFSMPGELTEISGLTYSTAKNILYSINDEKGNIYGINLVSGKIIDKIDFGKSDDYEGIAYHNNMIYVAESNGNIKVVNEKLSKREVEYDDILSRDNDVEGAVYNSESGTLLLAAKGNSREDDNVKNEKAIFSMNIENGEISKKPFLTIDLDDALKKLEKKHIKNNAIVNLSITSRTKDFAPSGIAIHPLTKDIYILSARGKLLVVMTQSGDVNAVIFLNQSMHVQPEGICFSPDGTLFISNEGRGRSGKIYTYLEK